MTSKLGTLAILALVGLSDSGWQVRRAAAGPVVDDAAAARELLAQAHGAPAVLCALAARSVQQRYGFGPWQPPGGVGDTSTALRWALERFRGEAAVPVLLDGLGNDDACVREFAARLVAQIESRVA